MKSKINIIAEIGVNHNGSFDQAIKLIQSAKKCGANTVKFQTLFAEEFVKRNTKKSKAGQGGPFIELRPDSEPSLHLKASITNLEGRLGRLSFLKNILGVMPFSVPMDSFSISSHYGKRRDPINRRWAMHYGLDLGSFMRAKVFSTAAGRVVKAGRKGKYGKFIEISHGQGFKTRYGHLHKILDKRGQKVDYRHKIGLLGSTGRSTGPHLHYEILYDGRPMNPWRFIKAGKYVYKN